MDEHHITTERPKHTYKITFKASDGITFFAYVLGTSQCDAVEALLYDVKCNGCPPFFPDARAIEEIVSIART